MDSASSQSLDSEKWHPNDGDGKQDEEGHRLLGVTSADRPKSSRQTRYTTTLLVASVLLLILSNITTIAVLFRRQDHHLSTEKAIPPWMPPEINEHRIFKFQPIFGEPPSNASESAWQNLIPLGKGFIRVPQGTEIPNLPGLAEADDEPHAIISVFHQLHCLYMTRKAYYAARAGNIDSVPERHLYHCWDYLRQSLMCHGDTTLEWLKAPPAVQGSTGWGYLHKCRNYDSLFEFSQMNRFKDAAGIASEHGGVVVLTHVDEPSM